MAAHAFIVNIKGLTGLSESGGRLYSEIRNTSTPTPLYSDIGLATPLTNPVIADALGTISCYFNTAIQYTWTAKTANDSVTLWQVDVVGGVVSLTYINPAYEVNPLIEASWVPALGAPLGTGWVTALAQDIDEILDDAKGIRVCATYAEMTALTADELTEGAVFCTKARATADDGGFGFWRYDATSTATADGGTIIAIDGGGTGRFFRLFAGPMMIDWFGSSADWGAALTAAWTASAATSGAVKMTPGKEYIFTTQAVMPTTEINVTWDVSGCQIRPRYAGGATFKFGSGAALLQEISIIGETCIFNPGTLVESGVSQPVFEFRGVRTVRTRGLRMLNLYQIAKWGDPADAQPCYQWFMEGCDIGMRSNANGGHSHGILGDGSSGGLYINDSFIEADASNVAAAVNFLHLTSAQGPDRLDHVSIQGGNIKGWDRAISAVDARIVNVEDDGAARYDESRDAAFYFEATSGAVKGGVESLRLHGNVGAGSGSVGMFLMVKANKAGIDFSDIQISDISIREAVGAAVHISTSGGSVSALKIDGVHAADCLPASALVDTIILDGDIDEATVRGVTITHKLGASNTIRYGVNNATAVTKSVWIEASITMDAYSGGVVYDPIVGDLSIHRFCAINPDGTPRRTHSIVLTGANFAANSALQQLTIQHSTGFVATSLPAPRRGRVVEFGVQVTGTVAAGTITFGPYLPTAIDTNLDVSFTSASGANPKAVVNYPAGTSEIAEAANLEVRCTTDASLSPTTLDAAAYIVFQEM